MKGHPLEANGHGAGDTRADRGQFGNGSFDADLEAGPETEIDPEITPEGATPAPRGNPVLAGLRGREEPHLAAQRLGSERARATVSCLPSAQRGSGYLFLFFSRALTKMSVDPSGPGARPKYSV